ncbi:hypothetical protein EVG20_g5625 [Dentipellis fragilis]|uniref:NADP-dependent oxidoreductase domain-containing protein n=1 Tax=Dentipellis fragilis TaxID=205917 RepID=A0A4Y9YSG2_9AGAM|nr:hypothetical protein EVG20_g5625 [Dentipellis fragilis]
MYTLRTPGPHLAAASAATTRQSLDPRQSRTPSDTLCIKTSLTTELRAAPVLHRRLSHFRLCSHSAAARMSKSALNIVMGTMNFGAPDREGTRVRNVKDIETILDVFQQHGHTEIDTARVYAGGTSEEYLGRIDWQSRGLKMETKLYPVPQPSILFNDIINHTPEASVLRTAETSQLTHLQNMRRHLDNSLKALNTDTLEMWYLHGPDRSTPYEVTLKAVNEFYKEGKFKRFGISNYMSWEVAEIVQICRANGYIQPTVYQGLYNAIHRAVEPELFPCLRKYGISFYEFNPFRPQEAGSSAFLSARRSDLLRWNDRYWKEPFFKALADIRAVADKHDLTMVEVALRWISHHSLLKREFGDSVLIGASSVEHIKQNLVDLEKGPLPDEVVSVLDEAWIQVQPYSSAYFH